MNSRGYEKAKDQDAYFQNRETQMFLFGGAENMLKRYGIKVFSLDVGKMQAEYEAMALRKAQLKKTYQTAEREEKTMELTYEKCGDYLI